MYKNLYPQICDFDNLLAAYEQAREGKKQTPEMYAFHSLFTTGLAARLASGSSPAPVTITSGFGVTCVLRLLPDPDCRSPDREPAAQSSTQETT